MNAIIEERRKSRKYDILVLGATGYTGALAAEYIAKQLPTDLKWAIAGRSRSKLETLAKKLGNIDSKRSQPVIEVVSFDNRTQVDSVVKNSKVCVSVVLYGEVGEVVIRSCIENGTDYIDVFGDTPLLRGIFNKYHDEAVKAKVALIHDSGVFCAPQDLLAWATVKKLAEAASLKTKEVISTISELEMAPSGGTVHSMMANSEYDAEFLEQIRQPWVLSPTEGSQPSKETNLLGMRREPTLGLLSDSSFTAFGNRALVHRTWSLLNDTDQGYGPNFRYSEYNKVSSTVAGVFSILFIALMDIMLMSKFLQRIAMLFLPKPGEGPDLEKAQNSRVKFEAVAVADTNNAGDAPRAYASFSYPSGPYHTTALFLAQGAASLLYNRRLEGGVEGGCLTPAFLGADVIKRVKNAGATFTVDLV